MPSSTNIKRTRPVFKTAAIDDQEKFKALPAIPGPLPYHLDLTNLIPDLPENKLVFHMAGDTGGLVSPIYKHQVANAMIRQCKEIEASDKRPQFFFHLGDVVYNFGQAEEYEPQFFEPYRDYPNPIFAIPGNHDADIDPFDPNSPQSLDAFIKVFCDSQSRPIHFAGDHKRNSNIQPNFYWKLITPLADIIALYSNVPRFGTITAPQRQWFIDELKASAQNEGKKALIVCLHHAPYSADTNHGSSKPMQLFFNGAFEESGVIPDIVFSGHVHNYQRFTKKFANGKVVPFIVAGAGGYADLHKIAPPGDPAFPDTDRLFDGVTLENYCDHTHGFLKIKVEKTGENLALEGTYYTIPLTVDSATSTTIYDTFTVDISGSKSL